MLRYTGMVFVKEFDPSQLRQNSDQIRLTSNRGRQLKPHIPSLDVNTNSEESAFYPSCNNSLNNEEQNSPQSQNQEKDKKQNTVKYILNVNEDQEEEPWKQKDGQYLSGETFQDFKYFDHSVSGQNSKTKSTAAITQTQEFKEQVTKDYILQIPLKEPTYIVGNLRNEQLDHLIQEELQKIFYDSQKFMKFINQAPQQFEKELDFILDMIYDNLNLINLANLKNYQICFDLAQNLLNELAQGRKIEKAKENLIQFYQIQWQSPGVVK